jgi:hypothetical protein
MAPGLAGDRPANWQGSLGVALSHTGLTLETGVTDAPLPRGAPVRSEKDNQWQQT